MVLFSKAGALVKDVTYPVQSSGLVRHLLTGMAPGTYHVTQNGQSAQDSHHDKQSGYALPFSPLAEELLGYVGKRVKSD